MNENKYIKILYPPILLCLLSLTYFLIANDSAIAIQAGQVYTPSYPTLTNSGIAGENLNTNDVGSITGFIYNLLIILASLGGFILFSVYAIIYMISSENVPVMKGAEKNMVRIILGFIFLLAAGLIFNTALNIGGAGSGAINTPAGGGETDVTPPDNRCQGIVGTCTR